MKNSIDYLNFDNGFFLRQYERLFNKKPKVIEVAKSNGDILINLYRNATEWITFKIVNGETDREELKSYFKLGMQAIYGHIKTLEHKGQPVKMTIEDEVVELVNESSSFDNVFDLKAAFTIASICRNEDVIKLIFSQKESGTFLKNGYHSYHPIYKIFIIFKDEEKVTEAAFADMEKASMENVKGSELKSFRELVTKPVLSLEKAYFGGTEQEFNDALKIAMEKHKSYYDSKEDNRFRDVNHWLPWYLISLACKAYDKGWNITVEDPRLPMFLVKGECNVASVK